MSDEELSMARSPMAAPMAGDTGAGMADDADATDDDGSGTVLVTIAQGPDGGFVVYAGDEPDEGEDESADDDDAAAGAGAGSAGAGAPGGGGAGAGEAGQHVDSIGAALKAALDILTESANSAGAPGSSEDQFASGYGSDQSPTPTAMRPARRGMKYPPAAAA